MGITRRDVLVGTGAALGMAALGCGSDAGGKLSGTPDGSAGTPPDGGGGSTDDASFPDAAQIVDATPDAAPIDHCTEPGTLTPEQLLGSIDTFVVLCMENRSFDHYLGSLRLVEGRADIDGLTGAESNPDPNDVPVPVHLLEDFTPADPPHSWGPVHAQWNEGANDGFVKAHAGSSQADVMGYHVREQLPITYALADAGAICHRWFSGCLGPTWPNRLYLHGATSNGSTGNVPVGGFTSIFDRLNTAGISNTNYFHDVAWAVGGYFRFTGQTPVEQFFTDAAAGTLPQFSLIDPSFFAGGANDDHPSHDVRLGQALIASVYSALAQSPQWERCVLVITYDEHGGFYDHVAPPEVGDADPQFTRMGFRVPTIVLGPKVRRGCAIPTVLEHSAICATLSKRFGLDPLNARAAAAADISSCIDPLYVDDPQPPVELPPVPVPLAKLRRRQELARHQPPSHEELYAFLERHPVPRHLDRRAEADAITDRVLDWGRRLGAVHFLP